MIKPTYAELKKKIQSLEKALTSLTDQDSARSGPPHFKNPQEVVEDMNYQAQRLEALIERSLLAIVTLDAENRILSCNEYFEKIFQYSNEEILGKDLDEVIAGDFYRQEAKTNTERVFNGKTIHNFGKRKRKDGSFIDVEIFGVPVEVDERVVGLYFIYLDISERKKMEDALRESEEKYRNILENMEEGYYEVDLNGHFTFINSALCRMLGYTQEELVGKNNRQFMDEENAKKIFKIFNQVYETGKPAKAFNYEFKPKDGSKRHAEISVALHRNEKGEPIGFRGIGQDITDRTRIELELVQTKNFLQNIIESSIDGITITDLKGIIIYASPSMEDILGYDPKEAMGMKGYLLYGNGLTEAKKIMRELTGKGALKNHELRMIRKNGKQVEINLSAALLKNQKGTIIGTMGIYRDITEKKVIETQLLQFQKLEALGTLAGGIAHNFNNLLMGILGNTSLMLLELEPEDPNCKRLQTIENLIQNGSKLTSQLLGYAREGKYEPQPLPFNPIVRETAQIFGMTRKEISIHYDLTEDLLPVVADKSQMEQVLLNLFINAADAMPQGGRLYLHTRNVTHHEMSGIPFEPQKGPYIVLSVRDTGIGMDQKTIERIFEPFYTTKGLSKGTGLGLASAYGIIKAHHGYIKVESQKGVGSVFYIYLPTVEDSLLQSTKAEVSEVRKVKRAVLLIDDEVPILEVGLQMLEKLGYTAFSAKSGEEALAFYRSNHDRVDAVILDMIMPGKSGSETFDRMRAINPNLKVLLASGYSIDGQAGKIMERGCKGFIQKPFNLEELAQKINEVLGS
jgi:PAS domain S-box-containing protein